MVKQVKQMLILGGGLAGLGAGCLLTRSGIGVDVFESEAVVGGISKTVEHNGFRFDLGGHRFFTRNARIDAFVKDLMGEELITVPRKSAIFLRGRYFDYPLKPLNAVFGMGVLTTLGLLGSYGSERVKRLIRKPEPVSLEDWVVAYFGRAMFDIYFKEYSEKVWGIDCGRISAEWAAQRIRGLSLSKAVANAFFRPAGKDTPSLVDQFYYPRLGIGRLAERLREEIGQSGKVHVNMPVKRICHSGLMIDNIVVEDGAGERRISGAEFISSIPIPKLIFMLDPLPPGDVLSSAQKLRFRDLVTVTLMIDRPRVTDVTWMYIPERTIPFGRLHEPTNWSKDMAPEGKTLLVLEFFSFQGDEVWTASDETLVRMSTEQLELLGIIRRHEVIDSIVVRVPKAYPLFDLGYQNYLGKLTDYLAGFKNLQIVGRPGMFKYYNMDHAIESGIAAAEKIMRRLSVSSSESRILSCQYRETANSRGGSVSPEAIS